MCVIFHVFRALRRPPSPQFKEERFYAGASANVSHLLDSLLHGYDKRLRPNYKNSGNTGKGDPPLPLKCVLSFLAWHDWSRVFALFSVDTDCLSIHVESIFTQNTDACKSSVFWFGANSGLLTNARFFVEIFWLSGHSVFCVCHQEEQSHYIAISLLSRISSQDGECIILVYGKCRMYGTCTCTPVKCTVLNFNMNLVITLEKQSCRYVKQETRVSVSKCETSHKHVTWLQDK